MITVLIPNQYVQSGLGRTPISLAFFFFFVYLIDKNVLSFLLALILHILNVRVVAASIKTIMLMV